MILLVPGGTYVSVLNWNKITTNEDSVTARDYYSVLHVPDSTQWMAGLAYHVFVLIFVTP